MEPVDDHLLSAFIAGTVTPEQRAQVLRHIADDADAREIVGMARQAMGAVDADPRAPTRARRLRRSPLLVRCALGALAVLTGGVALRIATQTTPVDTDRLRAQTESAPLTVGLDGDRFTWTAVPDAARYEVVVWDAVTAAVTARTVSETTATDDAFAATLRGIRASAAPQQVRVDAFDIENRLLASSALTAVAR